MSPLRHSSFPYDNMKKRRRKPSISHENTQKPPVRRKEQPEARASGASAAPNASEIPANAVRPVCF